MTNLGLVRRFVAATALAFSTSACGSDDEHTVPEGTGGTDADHGHD
jgi:hypothetical protein